MKIIITSINGELLVNGLDDRSIPEFLEQLASNAYSKRLSTFNRVLDILYQEVINFNNKHNYGFEIDCTADSLSITIPEHTYTLLELKYSCN